MPKTNTLPDILIGRRQIRQAMGNVCWSTARKKIKLHKIPITYMDGRPAIPRLLLIEYFTQRCRMSVQ